MTNYDIKFCKCGHIHAVPWEKVNAAVKANKDLVLICGRCGYITVIGADEFENGYNMYSYNLEFKENDNHIYTLSALSIENITHKAVSEIVYSSGYNVPMMNGEYADYFDGNMYCSFYIDTYEYDNAKKQGKVEEYLHNCYTVNMQRFIRETPDDILSRVSKYVVNAFDWKGTKYEQ